MIMRSVLSLTFNQECTYNRMGESNMFSKLSPLLSQVEAHIASISQVLEPLSPCVVGFLGKGVLNNGEMLSGHSHLGEK